jgi:integrative and conjugative element protein (TIGR02256 family)
MKLLLPLKIIKRLRREVRGRLREIGGVLVGEHVAADVFRVVDMSVQDRGGTVAHFVRDPQHHKAFLEDFFARTGHKYKEFNYIGEWHSHPAFKPLPSGPDFATMFDLVEDPDVGVNFAILIIVRLYFWGRLELSATLFRAGVVPEPISVELEETQDTETGRSAIRWIFDVFRR